MILLQRILLRDKFMLLVFDNRGIMVFDDCEIMI